MISRSNYYSLLNRIQKLFYHNEGFIKIYENENRVLKADWFPTIGDMDTIVPNEKFSETKKRYKATIDIRDDLTDMEIEQVILGVDNHIANNGLREWRKKNEWWLKENKEGLCQTC